MKRNLLTPEQSAWLNETIRRNRQQYGGFQMKEGDDADADKQQDDADQGDGTADKSDKSDGGDKGDKPPRFVPVSELVAERDERKKLRDELSQFKSALGAALGIAPEDDKTDQQADLLANVQEQIQGMQREAAVLKLANAHRITDEADLELLSSAKDDEAMKRLAERLAPTADESDNSSVKRRPKPDPSQGGGSGGGPDSSGVSFGRDLFKSSRGKSS